MTQGIFEGVPVACRSQADDRSKASTYRKAPQVKGYTARRGGYSYSYEDTINTYGDNAMLRSPNTKYNTIAAYNGGWDEGEGPAAGDASGDTPAPAVAAGE